MVAAKYMMCVKDCDVNIKQLKKVGSKIGAAWAKNAKKDEILAAVGNKLLEQKIVCLIDNTKNITRTNLDIKDRDILHVIMDEEEKENIK